jgi:trimethylamine--corrinoid protein Co-methyltransferase
LGDGNVHFGTGSTTAFVLDLDGTYRTGTENDIANFGRLSDAMNYLEVGNGMIWAQDVPKSVFHARYVEVLTKNCGKIQPAGDGLDQKTTDDIIRLVETVLGGRDEIGKKKTFNMTVCPQRALTFDEEATVIIETARAKLPNEICPMPLSGSMHPVTLAGALVQGNAEMLGGVVLNQLANPGAPMIYMIWPGMMDMSAVTNVFGCPEQVLLCTGFAQIARVYQIPSNIIVGQTEAKAPDQQAGYEKMMGMLLAALAGADEIALVGGLIDSGRVANYEQVLIDEEMAGYVQRILKGIDVAQDKLALDTIIEVGPGGTYLEHDHTLKYFKEEQHYPKLTDRSIRQAWEAQGSKDIREKAKEEARQILSEHKTDHLSDKTISELEREVAKIYKRESIEYRPFPIK